MTLTGSLNGAEICFTFDPQMQRFYTNVPKNASGTYVLELHLRDDAGNASNQCAAIVCIDFDALTVRVMSLDLDTMPQHEDYRCDPLSPVYAAMPWGTDYVGSLLPPEFTIMELR